jgi:GDPmannose 4,6-dehydratase
LNKTALIFGSSGQDGYYLNILLSKKNIKVINISRKSGDLIGDISDFEFVNNVIRINNPSYVFHLAAISSTSHNYLKENNYGIVCGIINILESLKINNVDCKTFFAGSAIQFVNNGLPINENTAFSYDNPYSIARNHAVDYIRYFRNNFNSKIYIGYLFNHDSFLRKNNHLNKKIINHVINVNNGSKEKLLIGNLNARKEFNHAKDIVDAIWVLVNQDDTFEVVIGSGISYKIKDWISYCFNYFNIKDWNNFIEIDKNYLNPYKILVSDPSLIKSLGWNNKIEFEELANSMINNNL